MRPEPAVPHVVPARLAPFLAQWDYMAEILLERLDGLTDEEYLWEPSANVWTVRPGDAGSRPDVYGWPPNSEPAPPRTIAWSMGHLGSTGFLRADYLDGEHRLTGGDLEWPRTAVEGVRFLRDGFAQWRGMLQSKTDDDLDTVGRSAFPHGLDPTLPLLDIVWWMNRELIFHSGEIWLMRDLYPALGGQEGYLRR